MQARLTEVDTSLFPKSDYAFWSEGQVLNLTRLDSIACLSVIILRTRELSKLLAESRCLCFVLIK